AREEGLRRVDSRVEDGDGPPVPLGAELPGRVRADERCALGEERPLEPVLLDGDDAPRAFEPVERPGRDFESDVRNRRERTGLAPVRVAEVPRERLADR